MPSELVEEVRLLDRPMLDEFRRHVIENPLRSMKIREPGRHFSRFPLRAPGWDLS